ncbi:gliding motility-associated-like protein [Flavobacterium cauense R2A-7]|uniref:Gliding motility-associated-like protein n=1 Tax=Flavobacterium cauense R2A-7 TaxID=1341154 RepID=A0A562LZA4_9FLAO|nr:T9SS type B sorting domain-containing protein [Flavobacterium cauense]KGO81073.1 hypothetical protein Q762_10580 [Flavobacterium cauense R2A-7]TWI12989.1 gliding motility-associated-like protein [Flavobacterium cauense R2A-7]
MERILHITLLLFCIVSHSQTITVDDTSRTPAQLVNLLLGNSCVEVSNISVSSTQSVAYFNQNGSVFPINEGIIIRNGHAIFSQGLYNNTNLSTQVNASTDGYLQTLSNNSGQTANITDVAFLEFDFIPLSSTFSFDFLFASNEYGQYQCGFSDVFAFVLTDLGSGISNNLAVIPGTSTPVTVKDIRDAAYNNSCSSNNPNFFGVYNVNNPAASTLNMRGHTVVMNASSAVTPGNPYKIRLVIGDYNDPGYDSAVFLAAGSFTTTLDLGPDRIICTGDSYTLDTNLDATYNYQWLFNGGPIPGANNPTYTVTQSGTYTVEITKGTCFITDTVIFNDLMVTNPINLQTCNTGSPTYTFDLTLNNEAQLGIDTAVYDIFYYLSPADIASNTPIPSGTLNSFNSAGGQTIYIKIFNTQTGNFCDAVYQFDLIVTNAVTTGTNISASICDNPNGQSFNLLNFNLPILNGASVANYTISYYNTQSDAQLGSNSIGSSVNIPTGTVSMTLWAQMQDVSNPNCFAVTSVLITVNPLPVVDTIPDPLECSSFTLPVIVNGTYYTGPNATGTQLNPGDTIDLSGTYYIFAGPDANGCTNESSFTATFIDEYIPVLDHCGTFTVPQPPFNVGAFYTDFGGPTGSGVLIPEGTVFTNATQATISQNLYYYAEMNSSVCVDRLFTINIHPIPLADDPSDITTCNAYTLPALTNGNYYALSGGPSAAGQIPFSAGDQITSSQTVYVFNSNPNCSIENSFTVNIVDTSVFTPVSACGSYTLPAISFGGYYDAPMGGGNPIDPNIPITTSQIVYFFANTSTLPNCTANLNYNITINALPIVDSITSGTYCGEFVLPVLTNGTYFTLPGGPTAIGQTPLSAGNIIDLTGTHLNPGTYYIYNGPNANNCTNESSFTISLNPFPPADGVLDRVECSPYSLSSPINGTIYTAPGGPSGGGSAVSSSDVFNTTMTFYLYNIDNTTGCAIEKPFTVTYSGLNLPDYPDVNVCEFENFTLPTLNHVPPTPFNYTIGYFYNPNGTNPVAPGTVFNTPNTQTTVYVFATNGDRITCTQEDSFIITVSETPVLPNYPTGNEYCGSYTLPTFPTVNYNINYYSQSGGVGLITPTAYTYSTPGTYTVYVYASATNNPNCNDETQFTFTIHPLLDIDFPDGIICVDPTTNETIRPYTINTGLNPAIYTVDWYLGATLMGTGPNYTATQEGTYDVRFTKLIPDVGTNCNFKDTQVVVSKSSAALATLTLSGAFENQIDIIVTINGGYGNYLFQLDDGPFQSGNIFYNVASGEHFITIKDNKGGCNDLVLRADVLHYPNFFTPNGDNHNDYWNIWDLKNQPDAQINIYDRYGKLLKQISPAGNGWDGTYNGQPLPSTDYWFQVFYKLNNQSREFRAHFSMKR